MIKLKITSEQYNRIILNERQSRLKGSGAIINETLSKDTQLLEEGWREIVLGVAMMMGIGLTGQNKIVAQNAVKNSQTMAEIKATLEDSGKTAELVKMLKDKGMKDPESKLADNAEKVMDTYNDIANNDKLKYRVDVKVVNNLQQLKGKLGQGYALKGAEISTDTVKGQQGISTIITVTDTMEINLGSDNLFVTGGFTLSQAGVDTITIALDEIKKQGGKIESVEVESSTDAEQIPKFMSKDDPTGNIQLANLRTQSITNELHKLGVDSNVTHREIPNNGAEVVSTQQFKQVSKDSKALVALRGKTSEYRYVKLKIVATFDTQDTTNTKTTPDQVIKHYRFELVKVIEASTKTHHVKSKITFGHKKFRCKKNGGVGKRIVDACTTFR
jgi:flagellar motor protein MotB